MKIEHPSASHLANKNNRQMELTPIATYDVHPAEDEQMIFEQQMKQAETFFAKQPTVGIPAITDDPLFKQEVRKKQTLEKLLFFKQGHTTDVELGGATFKLKILNSRDQTYVVELMREYAPKEGFKLSFMTLAASIVSVNDIPLEEFYDGIEKIDHPIIRKYYQISEWNIPVTTALMDAYNKFQLQVEEEYNKDFLKK